MPFGMVLQDTDWKRASRFGVKFGFGRRVLSGTKLFRSDGSCMRMPYYELTVPAERPQSLYMYMQLSTCTDVDAMCRCTGLSFNNKCSRSKPLKTSFLL
jgi:hypothetical protein